jgi:hypothetical protein
MNQQEDPALYQVNPATGAATFVAPLSGATPDFDCGAGLAWLDGQLWASNMVVDAGSGPQQWVGTIDTVTGAFSPVVAQGAHGGMPGLAADAAGHRLLSVAFDSDALVSITTAGGIQPLGPSLPYVGMAFNQGSGTVYGWDGPVVYELDPTTGAIVGTTISPNLGFLFYGGLEFDMAAERLYAVDAFDVFYHLTPGVNSSASPIGLTSLPNDRISGLALQPTEVPEPATVLLLLCGAAAAWGRGASRVLGRAREWAKVDRMPRSPRDGIPSRQDGALTVELTTLHPPQCLSSFARWFHGRPRSVAPIGFRGLCGPTAVWPCFAAPWTSLSPPTRWASPASRSSAAPTSGF